MRKSKEQIIVFFDVDNTLVKGQSQKLFIDYLFKQKFLPFWVYLKIILWFILYKLHLIENPRQAMDYSFQFSKGMTTTEMETLVERFFNEILINKLYSQSLKIIKKHQSEGAEVVLVSNAFEFLVKRVARYLEVQYVICTKLTLSKKILTGTIEGGIVYGENKATLIKQFLSQHNFSLTGSWAYADHISDLSALELVEHPVVINPDKYLLEEAQKRGWKIFKYY